MVPQWRISEEMKPLACDVAVVGGGAAGMAAAYFSAKTGADTVLLEKNEKLGKKLYITGKGRCNLTNDATLDEFLKEVPRNPKFLYSALSFFPPREVMRHVEAFGCPVKTERGRRVFPVSDKASDVTKSWQRALDQSGCRVYLDSNVSDIRDCEDGGFQITAGGRLFHAKCLIIATGGLSYPSTGSTGDGYAFARQWGVELQPRFPSLIALTTDDASTGALQGLSLRNVRLCAQAGKKRLYDQLGEMLFTDDGVSGPLALELSTHLPQPLPEHLSVYIDLKPGMTSEEIQTRLRKEITEAGKKEARTVLESFLPQRMAELFLRIIPLAPHTQANQLTGAERERICGLLKAFPLHVTGTHPIAEAVVTRGGVSVKALDPATMAVKARRNLFFCGEVIDVDAHTGGYNLQIAFATGALAGHHAAILAKTSH